MKTFKYFAWMCLVASVGSLLFSEIVEITTGYNGHVDSVVLGGVVGLAWADIAPKLGIERP